jgi:hypothetical protein
MKILADEWFPQADEVRVVLDQLNDTVGEPILCIKNIGCVF